MADTRTMFNWGYEGVELRGRFAAADTIGRLAVTGGTESSVRVGLRNAANVFAAVGSTWQIVSKGHSAPVAAGDPAGVLRYYDGYGNANELELVFLETVGEPPLIMALAGNWRAWAAMGAFGVCFAAFRGRRRPQRRVSGLHAR
jgi:D-alanyl-D-alanine carboxypeptidase